MSETPIDYRDRLNLREQIDRIDRQRAETQKLFAESQKLTAEQQKLFAESLKFNREIWIVPLTVAGAILAAVIARLPEILHAFGVGH